MGHAPSIQRAANHALAGDDFAGRRSHDRADALGINTVMGKGSEGRFQHIQRKSRYGRFKPSFKGAGKAGRRCLVLVGGFFEWRAGVADKQPFAFAMGNHQIMPMAGLWEPWKNPENGEWLRSCTVITAEGQ